jgi:hypothetical protein
VSRTNRPPKATIILPKWLGGRGEIELPNLSRGQKQGLVLLIMFDLVLAFMILGYLLFKSQSLTASTVLFVVVALVSCLIIVGLIAAARWLIGFK